MNGNADETEIPEDRLSAASARPRVRSRRPSCAASPPTRLGHRRRPRANRETPSGASRVEAWEWPLEGGSPHPPYRRAFGPVYRHIAGLCSGRELLAASHVLVIHVFLIHENSQDLLPLLHL